MQKINITVNTMLELGYHEAILLQAYKDTKKVWTWSVGLTSASGHNVERYIDNPATMETALSVWVWALKRYADDVLKAFEGYELKQHEFDAALSFHWNTGRIKSASWVGLVKAGKREEAKSAFMWWNQPKEIEPRRRMERDLFFEGTYANDGKISLIRNVNKNYQPVYSSAVKVDIRKELEDLLGLPSAAEIVSTLSVPREQLVMAPVDYPTSPVAPTPQVAVAAKQSYTVSDAWRALNLWLIKLFG